MCDVCGSEPEWLNLEAEQPVSVASSGTEYSIPAARESGTRDSRQRELSTPSLALAPLASPEMMEYLREWRRELARKNAVPAYIVLHDTSLEELCRVQPRSRTDLLQVTGIGERKADLYGAEILAALERFRQGARATVKPEKEQRISPAEETVRMLAEGKTFVEIAQIRGRQVRTVVETVSGLIEKGELGFQPAWIPAERRALIEEQAGRLGLERLKPIKEALPEDYSYDEIKLVVANLRLGAKTGDMTENR